MRLTEEDKKNFQTINQSGQKRWWVNYCERWIQDLFSPENLTKDNLDGRKDMAKQIKENMVDRINLTSDKKVVEKNQFV